MKIKFKSDDDLLLEIPVMTIVVRVIFLGNNKSYPQAS